MRHKIKNIMDSEWIIPHCHSSLWIDGKVQTKLKLKGQTILKLMESDLMKNGFSECDLNSIPSAQSAYGCRQWTKYEKIINRCYVKAGFRVELYKTEYLSIFCFWRMFVTNTTKNNRKHFILPWKHIINDWKTVKCADRLKPRNKAHKKNKHIFFHIFRIHSLTHLSFLLNSSLQWRHVYCI